MVGYYFGLALRSLRRTPVMTGFMVLAIGLGIGASMTMITVLHVMTDDPMPGQSSHLFAPHIDPLPIKYKGRWIWPRPKRQLHLSRCNGVAERPSWDSSGGDVRWNIACTADGAW